MLKPVLEAQVTEQLQATPYERTDQRRGYRKGYQPRQLTSRIGTLSLRVPQVREGQFSSELFARYQRSEQAYARREERLEDSLELVLYLYPSRLHIENDIILNSRGTQ